MRVITDKEAATFTFVPVESEEAKTLVEMMALLAPEDTISYGGRGPDDEDGYCSVYLHVGSHEEERTKTVGLGSITRSVMVGGVKLHMRGSNIADKQQVGLIRDISFLARGEMIYLGSTEIDGKPAMVVAGRRCQHCQVGMVSRIECEWRTCNGCALKCQHTYIRGITTGGGVNVGYGDFCKKCGRGRPLMPGERQRSELEQQLEAERESAVMVVYREGFPHTPTQAVKLLRFGRRLAKARKRQAAV